MHWIVMQKRCMIGSLHLPYCRNCAHAFIWECNSLCWAFYLFIHEPMCCFKAYMTCFKNMCTCLIPHWPASLDRYETEMPETAWKSNHNLWASVEQLGLPPMWTNKSKMGNLTNWFLLVIDRILHNSKWLGNSMFWEPVIGAESQLHFFLHWSLQLGHPQSAGSGPQPPSP